MKIFIFRFSDLFFPCEMLSEDATTAFIISVQPIDNIGNYIVPGANIEYAPDEADFFSYSYLWCLWCHCCIDICIDIYERTWSLNLLPHPEDCISFHPRFPHPPCNFCQPCRLPHDECKFCQSCARLPHVVFKFCQPRLPQPDDCKSRHARFSSWSSSKERV